MTRHFVRAHILYRTGAAVHLVETDAKGEPLGPIAVCGANMSHPRQIWTVGGDDPLTCRRCNRAPVASDLSMENDALSERVRLLEEERDRLRLELSHLRPRPSRFKESTPERIARRIQRLKRGEKVGGLVLDPNC